tara:strand:+ start:163 stop:372 length:210 start_codon:yes stop_codon:yes gene_type:complete
MRLVLERIKKSPFLTREETVALENLAKKNEVKLEDLGLFIDRKQPTIWRKRKYLKVPRIYAELFDLSGV